MREILYVKVDDDNAQNVVGSSITSLEVTMSFYFGISVLKLQRRIDDDEPYT